MAISTGEIVMLVFLALVLGIAVWWFIVAFQYGKSLKVFAYTRGANLDLGAGDPTAPKSSGTVDMKCDSDREICVWRGTAVCSGESTTNHELSSLDPIAGGSSADDEYGAFNSLTTIDMTADMAKGNGQESYTYTFDASKLHWPGGAKCPNAVGTRSQLIATYTCIPKGSKCATYDPSVKPS